MKKKRRTIKRFLCNQSDVYLDSQPTFMQYRYWLVEVYSYTETGKSNWQLYLAISASRDQAFLIMSSHCAKFKIVIVESTILVGCQVMK